MEICKKYVWDLGEHEIQNVDNHSYEILDPYLEGCKRYDVYVNYSALSYATVQCLQGPAFSKRRGIISGTNYQFYGTNRGFNPKIIEFIAESRPECNGAPKTFKVFFVDYEQDCSTPHYTTRTLEGTCSSPMVISVEFIEVLTGQSPPIKLKIIDGGIEHLYSIDDKNSVQLIEYECGCPPNQLDCGDCCLDCNSTFNQISEIRSLVSRIR